MGSWGKAWANHPKAQIKTNNLFNSPTPKEKDERNKYGIDITPEGKANRTSGGRVFDSLAEKNRYHTLLWRVKAGEITDLIEQKRFDIVVNGIFITAYVADFVYTENGVTVVEDCKGMLTKEYKIKKNLIKAVYGIDIKET